LIKEIVAFYLRFEPVDVFRVFHRRRSFQNNFVNFVSEIILGINNLIKSSLVSQKTWSGVNETPKCKLYYTFLDKSNHSGIIVINLKVVLWKTKTTEVIKKIFPFQKDMGNNVIKNINLEKVHFEGGLGRKLGDARLYSELDVESCQRSFRVEANSRNSWKPNESLIIQIPRSNFQRITVIFLPLLENNKHRNRTQKMEKSVLKTPADKISEVRANQISLY